MGICAQQHRICTGKYSSKFLCVLNHKGQLIQSGILLGKIVVQRVLTAVGLILYCYLLCLLMAIYVDVSKMSAPPINNFTSTKLSDIDYNKFLKYINSYLVLEHLLFCVFKCII